MKLKSYFSGTVEAALELAHKELGEDALLVNVRPAAIETRHLGAYEVVFGVTSAPATNTKPEDSSSTPREKSLHDRPAEGPANSRGQAGRPDRPVHGSLNTTRPVADPTASRPDHYRRLIEAEMAPELARTVAQGKALEDLFTVDATLGRPGSSRAVVALVGPPGVGKTTTLAKLAVCYGLAGRKRTHFLSADVVRVAAAEQLRTLAAILGLGCDITETPVALGQALQEHRLKDLILIDTPGFGRADLDDGQELAQMLASHPEIDVHLVLPASMKPGDLARAADGFAAFRPAKLIFTKLDETTRFGALVSEASRSGLPISFLATGQDIPDAMEPATMDRLAVLVDSNHSTFARSDRPTSLAGSPPSPTKFPATLAAGATV